MTKELEKTMPQESIEKAKYKYGVLKEIRQIDALNDELKEKIEELKKEYLQKQKPLFEKLYNENLVADLCEMLGYGLPALLVRLNKMGIVLKGKGRRGKRKE